MTTLYFTNPGEIDIRGATVAGLSAKDSDKPIGHFGTGLKYGIACVLRWGGSVVVYSGTTKYEFTTQNIQFRGKGFAQVLMNGEPLGFTTEYGKHWEPWQVFREFYANALDEGGTVDEMGVIPVASNRTIIVVKSIALAEPYNERNKIILPSSAVYDDEAASVKLLDQPNGHVYYRGVRVADKTCAVTYNIMDEMQLTEDRTVKDTWTMQYKLAHAIQACTNRSIITKALNCGDGHYEKNFDYSSYYETSPEFIDIAKRLYRENPSRHHNLEPIIVKHAPELMNPEPITDMPKIRRMMLAKAIQLVAKMGVNPCTYKIHVAELGGSILGKYSQETGEIFLSPEVFNQGTKQVLSTLYEELIHAETGKADCNYDMQTFLFNTIVSLYEEHVFQEPI